MIPLKDSRRSPGFAWGTWALVAANLLAFVWELRLGPGLEEAISGIALSPAETLRPAPFLELAARLPRLVAALFLHGGWLHLLGNMAFLAVFGDDVESRLRPRRYLLLYLGSGLVASAAQIAASPRSTLPLLGASGAIAGVLGAFLVLFPKARLAGGVAWYAHLAGFAAGPILLYLLRRR